MEKLVNIFWNNGTTQNYILDANKASLLRSWLSNDTNKPFVFEYKIGLKIAEVFLIKSSISYIYISDR